ncbi:hypothetical protein A4G99_16345 [Haladaptatus sp. R4]|nr:hypothetical protein A4G99_16345 [Haladaptatus sp. R4]
MEEENDLLTVLQHEGEDIVVVDGHPHTRDATTRRLKRTVVCWGMALDNSDGDVFATLHASQFPMENF